MSRSRDSADSFVRLNFLHGNPGAAFTLLEVILVLLIFSLAATLVLPVVASRLGHLDEHRRLVRLVSEVRHLRDMAFSLRIPARVSVDGTDLILSLDGREVTRFPLSAGQSSEGEILLNRFGMTPGGTLNLEMERKWSISMAPGSGRVFLERAP